MPERGSREARKVIYIPGVAQVNIADSKPAQASLPLWTAGINAMATVQNVGTWSWQYTDNPADPDRPAANAHVGCFLRRLKSRTPALC